MYKIAISGKANSGKNTTANVLLQELALKHNKEELLHKVVAFADPIKEIILKMFPQKAHSEFLYGRSEFRSYHISGAKSSSGNELSYRQALIDIGTMGRRYNPNIWVDCFDSTYQKILNDNAILKLAGQEIEALIVSDLRFKEELDYLKKENFYIIKLYRNDYTIINHASETDQDGFKESDFDAIIYNNGTLEDLRNNIKDKVLNNIAY